MSNKVKDLSVEDIMQKIKSEIYERRIGRSKIKSSEMEKFKNKPFYHVTDFYTFEGKEFIEYSYIGVLKREAEQDGLNSHLKKMSNNAATKEEVLKSICNSEEGKIKKTKILGLNNSCNNRDINKILTGIKLLELKGSNE